MNLPTPKAEPGPAAWEGPGALIFVDMRAVVAEDTIIVLCCAGGGGAGVAAG